MYFFDRTFRLFVPSFKSATVLLFPSHYILSGGFGSLKPLAANTLSSNLVSILLYLQGVLLDVLKSSSNFFVNLFRCLDRVIQKKRRDYSDSNSTNNMKRLNEDLNNIQDIMRKTIDDLIDR